MLRPVLDIESIPPDEAYTKYCEFTQVLNNLYVNIDVDNPIEIQSVFDQRAGTHFHRSAKIIYPGRPLYDLINLCYIVQKFSASSDAMSQVIMKQAFQCLVDLVEWQNYFFDNIKINEFIKARDFELERDIISAAMDALVRQAGDSCHDEKRDQLLVIKLQDTLQSLRKKLFVLLSNDKRKFNKTDYATSLGVLQFEVYANKVLIYINRHDYQLAEIYANKALNVVGKLCPTERKFLSCYLKVSLAYIHEKMNDADTCMHYIKEVLISLKDKGNRESFLRSTRCLELLVSACKFTGNACVGTNEIDTAITYYQVALEYCKDPVAATSIRKTMHELLPLLVNQLGDSLKQKQFIFSSVVLYPKYSQVCFYFNSASEANEVKSYLSRHEYKPMAIKNNVTDQKEGFGIIITTEFELSRFIAILDKVHVHLRKKAQNEIKHQKRIANKLATSLEKEDKEQEREPDPIYPSHPKAASRKNKPNKKATKELELIPKESRLFFLERRNIRPLQVVEFKESGCIFDPNSRNGVVTLRVENMSGNWFAFISPEVAKEFESNAEFAKIMRRFNSESELGNDLCVPCLKEMEIKQKQLGVSLPYIFKIRMMSKDNRDVRIYAKKLETNADGKTLVVFSAVSYKAHSKSSRPDEVSTTKQKLKH